MFIYVSIEVVVEYSQLSLNGRLYKTDDWCRSLHTDFQSFHCI